MREYYFLFSFENNHSFNKSEQTQPRFFCDFLRANNFRKTKHSYLDFNLLKYNLLQLIMAEFLLVNFGALVY